MKIFFTGASSFSGFWFAKTLAEAGHEVTATFTRSGVEDYPEAGFALARVEMVQDFINPVWEARMGSDTFFDALEKEEWDLVCLHGAYVADHKAADFPVLKAVESNTTGILRITEHLATNGAPPVIWTGSYFEAGEGQGTEPLRNFSLYALSKQLSWEFIRFYCERVGLPVAKFVMSNPFGSWEGKGFTSYLARTWLADEIASVQTPDYIRDNCPIDLLAKAYVSCAEQLHQSRVTTHFSPSGFTGKQGAFAESFARELELRWSRPCKLHKALQTDFPEPQERHNMKSAKETVPDWDEAKSWDQMASWYRENLGGL